MRAFRPTPTEDRYDVVVVGARAAGAATAMLLADAGMRVLVVDRSRYGVDTLSTHALMRGGVMQLHRWGLLEHVIDKGTPPVRRVTFHYADDELVVKIKPQHGVDALYAPRRTVLDPILVDAAERAGADVRYGVTVSGVQAQLQGPRHRHRRSRREGPGRLVRRRARHRRRRHAVDDRAACRRADRAARHERDGGRLRLLARPRAEGDDAGYEWIFRPGAGAGVIPTNDGESCVFVGGSPSRVGTGGERVMQEHAA